jgi:hypothetical protein
MHLARGQVRVQEAQKTPGVTACGPGMRHVRVEPKGDSGAKRRTTMNVATRPVPYDDQEAEGAPAWTCASGSFKR